MPFAKSGSESFSVYNMNDLKKKTTNREMISNSLAT